MPKVSDICPTGLHRKMCFIALELSDIAEESGII